MAGPMVSVAVVGALARIARVAATNGGSRALQREVERFFRDYGPLGLDNESSRPTSVLSEAKLVEWCLCVIAENNPEPVAAHQVAATITQRLEDVERQIDYHDGRFRDLPSVTDLVEFIWLYVGDAALGRYEVRRCAECGAFFLVTDNRQRYCPPPTRGGKSRCLTRRQMREKRVAQRVPSSHG